MRSEPFNGEVNIAPYSSLRKLMRAARRGKIPPERLGVIKRAVETAHRRRDVYLSAHVRAMRRANTSENRVPG